MGWEPRRAVVLMSPALKGRAAEAKTGRCVNIAPVSPRSGLYNGRPAIKGWANVGGRNGPVSSGQSCLQGCVPLYAILSVSRQW